MVEVEAFGYESAGANRESSAHPQQVVVVTLKPDASAGTKSWFSSATPLSPKAQKGNGLRRLNISSPASLMRPLEDWKPPTNSRRPIQTIRLYLLGANSRKEK